MDFGRTVTNGRTETCKKRMGAMQHCLCNFRAERPIFQPSDEGQQRVLANLERTSIMNIARSFNNWRKYRQTCNELGRMTDRELNDLGIGRGDIQYVARQAVK